MPPAFSCYAVSWRNIATLAPTPQDVVRSPLTNHIHFPANGGEQVKTISRKAVTVELDAFRVNFSVVSDFLDCRLAIRAANLNRSRLAFEPGCAKNWRNFFGLGKRGAIEGPIRIPSCSLLFLFIALAFPIISSKSLKFRPAVFSIFTAHECADNAKGCQPAIRMVHLNRFYPLRFVGTT